MSSPIALDHKDAPKKALVGLHRSCRTAIASACSRSASRSASRRSCRAAPRSASTSVAATSRSPKRSRPHFTHGLAVHRRASAAGWAQSGRALAEIPGVRRPDHSLRRSRVRRRCALRRAAPYAGNGCAAVGRGRARRATRDRQGSLRIRRLLAVDAAAHGLRRRMGLRHQRPRVLLHSRRIRAARRPARARFTSLDCGLQLYEHLPWCVRASSRLALHRRVAPRLSRSRAPHAARAADSQGRPLRSRCLAACSRLPICPRSGACSATRRSAISRQPSARSSCKRSCCLHVSRRLSQRSARRSLRGRRSRCRSSVCFSIRHCRVPSAAMRSARGACARTDARGA